MNLDDFDDTPLPRQRRRKLSVQLSGTDLDRFETCCGLVDIPEARVLRLAIRAGLPIVERELQLAARIREATSPTEPKP